MANPAYFGFIAFFESAFTNTTAATIHQMQNAIHHLVAQLVDLGRQDGSIRTDLPTPLVINMLQACSYGIIQLIVNRGSYLMADHQMDLRELFEAYLATLTSGLRA